MSLILRAHTAVASQGVVPSWPVESFIAVNPLAGHEAEPFTAVALPDVRLTRTREAYLADRDRGRITDADLEAALRDRVPEITGAVTVGATTFSSMQIAVIDLKTAGWGQPAKQEEPASWLDDYLATWVSSYLNPDALWPMPHKQDGLYGAWRALARKDPSLPRSARRKIAGLPTAPDLALSGALEQLGVSPEAVPATLRQELAFLPGWVGHIKWRAEKIGDIDLISYLAVRFTVRAVCGIPLPHPSTMSTAEGVTATTTEQETAAAVWERAENVIGLLPGRIASTTVNREEIAAVARILAHHPVSEHPFTWQKAYELHYRVALLPTLAAGHEDQTRPEMQVVMCIDPRSEGMRRHLEETPNLDSYGFAGFFGIPVRFARYLARGAIDSLPALLTSRHHITETPTDSLHAEKYTAQNRALGSLRRATHVADSATMTPFAFAETTGWLYGISSALKTFTPTLHAKIRRTFVPSADSLDTTVTIADAFSVDERASLAETAVRMMGMTRFAPLVVLAGHASESMNNLYQSSLECGACGGNPGAANARAAAAIFNDPEVRALLRNRGIDIPDDSFFVAAEHNTVSDAVTLLDVHLIPDSHAERAAEFDRLQNTASDQLVDERAIDLPGASPTHSPSRVRRRANDWAEVYPELGLAGNAAMIIGPRTMTRGVDLGRRTFLHSYETQLDPDGTALETIMTAPLVVAQWINHQYYFSALNPTTLGAGTKTIHNAIGTIGVLAGQSGDLRRGLPWQSVGFGGQLFHEPMRLSVIVQAPLGVVGAIISRNQVLRNLLDNDWITLTARDDRAATWHNYTQYGWAPTAPTMKGL